MSSTGATLSGSYTGASSTPTAVGFEYRPESGNLTVVPATDNSGTLSATLSNLSPGTKYYYRAFVTVYGTLDYASQSLTIYGEELSFTTKKVSTATVTTNAASNVAQATAVLNGQFAGASGQIYETGFLFGTSENNLTERNDLKGDGTNNLSGTFNKTVTGLNENTTYYFKAYVREMNENTGNYDYKYGSVLSFKTQSASVSTGNDYLDCYEVPDISGILSGIKTSGTSNSGHDKWYRYYTTSNTKQVATHTFEQYSTNVWTRNYTVLYDESKYAPVWVAYAMHSSTWHKYLSGRSGSWGTDDAISLTQQSGLDNASTVGYSRGHMVSSQERQTTNYQNDQTFYYTNQAPQWQNSFNGGIWNTMEQRIVDTAPSGRDTLYVVTGVLYEGTVSNNQVTSSTVPTLASGKLQVPIPSHFYKCMMKCSFDANGTMTAANGIAFIMTNEAHSSVNYYDSGFVSSIDAIETRTGIDFFPNVPSNLQNSAEANTNHYWFTGQGSANGITGITDMNWGSF